MSTFKSYKIVKDSTGKVHPWPNNDRVCFTNTGVPCRAISYNDNGTITIELAKLNVPGQTNAVPKDTIGQFNIFELTVRSETFLNFRCA